MKQWMGVRAISLAGALVGCVGAPDDAALEQGSQALNGTITFDPANPCTAAEQAMVNAAMSVAVNQVVTQPAALTACLRDATLSPDRGSFAEAVTARVGEDLPTRVGCAQLGTTMSGATINASGPLNIADEEVTFDVDLLAGSTAARVASILLHELSHNKGFRHLGGVEYQYSVPEQIEACSLSLSAGAAAPNGPARGAMQGEVELQQMGGDVGGAFERVCPTNNAISGLTLFTTTSGVAPSQTVLLNGFSAQCRSRQGGAAISLTIAGSGGTAVTRSCGANSVVVGLTGSADDTVDRLAVVCQTLSSVQAGQTSPTTTLTPVGGSTLSPPPLDVTRRCPAGTAVRAVYGRAGSTIGQLRLVCESMTTPGSASLSDAATLGNQGAGADETQSREFCNDRGIMSGLYGHLDAVRDVVARLGGQCRGTARAAGGLEYRVGAGDHVTPAEGRLTAGDTTELDLSCPSTMGLVSITAGTDPATGMISYVRGACANVKQWDGNGIAQMMTTPVFGTDHGNGVTSSCPADQFVVGLEVRSQVTASARSVETIVPVCRRVGG